MAPAHPRENKRGEITGYQVKRRLGEAGASLCC